MSLITEYTADKNGQCSIQQLHTAATLSCGTSSTHCIFQKLRVAETPCAGPLRLMGSMRDTKGDWGAIGRYDSKSRSSCWPMDVRRSGVSKRAASSCLRAGRLFSAPPKPGMLPTTPDEALAQERGLSLSSSAKTDPRFCRSLKRAQMTSPRSPNQEPPRLPHRLAAIIDPDILAAPALLPTLPPPLPPPCL